MGTKLVSISESWAVTVLGDVGGTDHVRFDYSFDYLAIRSNEDLFLWNGTTLQQITDVDLGAVVDFAWVDGYFMTTDGTYLVVTELNDPFSVNPLKYGSSEVDPDPILAILKLRDEIYALNQNTIEVFNNVGGANFPFQRVPGAQIQRGTAGTNACCLFFNSIAFCGGARNEPIAVWGVGGGTSLKLSSREVDLILAGYEDSVLAEIVMESRVLNGSQYLYIHLPDQTLVYDATATVGFQEPVWFTLGSSILGKAEYRAKNFVWCYSKWIVGDSQTSAFGTTSSTVSSHWGSAVGWEFGTPIVYNEAKGAIFHELELISLTGRSALGADSTIWSSYSDDGVTWSQERPCKAGRQGNRGQKISWLRQGYMRGWRIQKFRGTSDAHVSVAKLEVRAEPLTI